MSEADGLMGNIVRISWNVLMLELINTTVWFLGLVLFAINLLIIIKSDPGKAILAKFKSKKT